jgi:hypothetical protein
MIYFLISLILVLIVFIGFLFLKNSKTKQQHLINIQKLEEIIISLNQKQLNLNQKVAITTDYNSNYWQKIKNISQEIVELQNVLVSIIDEKN